MTTSAPAADQLDERLYRLLQLVIDWLKFAEAKNVAMVGFASSAIAVLLGFLAATNELLPFAAAILLAVGGLGLLLALLVSLASFMPQTNVKPEVNSQSPTSHKSANLFYFGHIAAYEPPVLVEEMIRRNLRGKSVQVDDGHIDLAEQVVINARITLRKLRLFTLSVVCFAVGVVGSGAGVLVAVLQ